MSAKTILCAAILLALAGCVHEPTPSPPPQPSKSNFIKADSVPWQTVCEWSDADGKFRNRTTDGLDRPSVTFVPADALCVKLKHFNFPNGRFFSHVFFQKDRPTPVQLGHSTNLMYVIGGHAHNMVDGQAMDSDPGDAFAQMGDKPHQSTALSADYEQLTTVLPNVGPEDGLKVSEADLARGNLVHHRDVPKREICMFAGADGASKTAVRNADNTAAIPAGASCFTLYYLLARPGGNLGEVTAKKGAKTVSHPEELDKIIYIVKGRVKATVDGETQELKTGDAVLHPGGKLHADEYLEDTVFIEVKFAKSAKTP